jgi:hypothetical protein
VESQAENQLKLLENVESMSPFRSKLKAAVEPVKRLNKEYQELLKRAEALPIHRDLALADMVPFLQKDANDFRERVDASLACLRAELEIVRGEAAPVEQVLQEQTHCAACGQNVPKAPFCLECGSIQPIVIVCAECGEKDVVPAHFFPEGALASKEFFCSGCGAVLTGKLRVPRTSVDQSKRRDSSEA